MNEHAKFRYGELKGRLITYQNSKGLYRAGIVEDVDSDDPDILYITDSDGAEHVVNYRYVDIIPQ